MKRHIDSKRRNKTVPMCADDIVAYVENPKKFYKTLPRTKKWVWWDHKIQNQQQKSIIQLHTSNEHMKIKILNTIYL